MTPQKKLFDMLSAIGLSILLSPLLIGVAVVVLVRDGRPVLYKSKRMKTPTQSFLLWKFRTMTVVARDSGVSGGHKSSRVTKTGRILRRYRLDELPQLWNILRGDISFVGPRPPLPRYVHKYPEVYKEVLKAQPGITGLATIAFHKHEEMLLAKCQTAQETEEVYCRRCIPRKARIDRIYAGQSNVCADFKLMWATVIRRVSMHKRPR
ncbi:sugar transferase [Puniceibacterium sediminis]|uniref:Sugar transferase involved in LPS biosynthesis (Colanic, teichoic acid) n=1 Tax=Puniceibacterium sediminis TaxID=1608407 RepID=A0A238VS26_9RHOB|nr:sugar transferase [Puniceibacterium sediminis]SNR37048.1 Sugar transferase involved in LPS biosynthesis (colanic, teichoic acid) [Puniceibacterium sediminis]